MSRVYFFYNPLDDSKIRDICTAPPGCLRVVASDEVVGKFHIIENFPSELGWSLHLHKVRKHNRAIKSDSEEVWGVFDEHAELFRPELYARS